MKMPLSIVSKEYQDLEEKVVNGTRWLDKNIPNWWKYVRTNSFAIENPCLCVLGQLDLWDSIGGNAPLSLATMEVQRHGFDLDYPYANPYSQPTFTRCVFREHAWNTLQYLWMREIRERQNPSFGNDVY